MSLRTPGTKGPRLIVIGLDGASFNYLDPILESGDLPGFRRFFESGVRSDCISTIPPLTPPAWSTMLTGVNPGKHGIFDFLQPDECGSFRVVDARHRRRRTFLDHASDNDIQTISLLVPYTFPPDPNTKGLVVSGLGTPSSESDFIRPHSFRDSLLRDFPFLREVDPTKGQSIETLHQKLLEQTRSTVELSGYAMEKVDGWGLCFTVFQATDLVPHFYSKYFDPEHPDFEAPSVAPEEFRDALAAIYRAIDPYVERCLDLVEKVGGWLILVSDHGSQPLMGAIGKDAFLARWLKDEGLLATSGEKGRTKQAAMAGIGSLANRLLYLAKKHTPHGIRDAVNRLLGNRKEELVGKLTAIPFMEDIVWEKTKAFCAPGGYGVGLYINREGDFPHGNVAPGAEYHKLRDELKEKLEALEIADGVPLFTRILTRDEALWGPFTRYAPDLLLMWREDARLKENGYQLVDGRRLDPPEERPGTELTWCGTHRMEGLFAAAGEGVSPGAKLTRVPNLSDILPTIHMLAGLPIPGDVDGKMIEDAFEREFIDSHRPIIGPPEDVSVGTGEHPSEDDSEKMIDLLQGMGYLH